MTFNFRSKQFIYLVLWQS